MVKVAKTFTHQPSAYDEGRTEQHAGKSQACNPYQTGTIKYERWNDGFYRGARD